MARRQVSIFINGREVANQIKSITTEKRKITRELNNMVIGSDEYIKKSKELQQVNDVISEHRTKLKGVKEELKIVEGSVLDFTNQQKKLTGELENMAIGTDEYLAKFDELKKVNTKLDTHKQKFQKVKKEVEIVEGSMADLTRQQKKLTEELHNTALETDEYKKKAAKLDSLNATIDKHRGKVNKIESTWSKVSKGVGKFAAVAGIAFGAEMIVDYGKKLFSLGTEMELLTKKANTVFGEALPLVSEQAAQNANDLGLTTSQYIDQAAAIGDLLIPMGFQRDEAANISSGLVDLSGALSEWSGGQKSAEEVSKTLAKAMLGEREELKGLGISISEADVKNRLALKGLQNLTGEYLQQAKAAATLELITEKSADAQAAFANNSETSARKQAKLTAKLTDVTEKLATALLPVFNRLLEVAIPVVDVIAEVVDTLVTGTEPTGQYAKTVNSVAETMRSLWERIAGTFNILRAWIDFLSGDSQKAILRATLGMKQLGNSFLRFINQISEYLGFGKFELFDTAATQSEIDAMSKQVDDGEKKKEEVKRKAADNSALQRRSEEEKAAKERAKAAEKEADALRKKYQRLQEIIDNFKEENRLEELSEDDRKLEELRLKYQDQIELTKELEKAGYQDATAQRIELERLRDEALNELRGELFANEMQQLSEQESEKTLQILAARQEREEAKRAAEETINAQIRAVVFSDQQNALFELETHYAELIALAEQNGVDTTGLKIAQKREEAEVIKNFDNKEIAELEKQQAERAQALEQSFNGLSSVISGALKLVGEESEEFAILQKGLALTQIGIDTARAISSLTAASSANPANAVTGGIAGAAQFASGLIQIFANIAQAKQILEQRKEGGYHNVVGKDDGISYRARYIGSPASGMLPNRPVVLASEAGAEYFVSNRDLQNPVVANYVRMIDNISRNRMPQFRDGGFSGNSEAITSAPTLSRAGGGGNMELMLAVSRLNSILERGIPAYIDDDEIVRIFRQFSRLDEASGGTLN